MSAKIFGLLAIIIGIIMSGIGAVVAVDREVLGNILVIIGIAWVVVGVLILAYYTWLTPR